MNSQETDKWKENIRYIVRQVTKKQISEVLTSLFELEDMPEIIALNRGKTSIKGYILIKKKVFEFAIIFLKQENELKMVVDLYFGKHALVRNSTIIIEENETEIDIYLSENKQYLLSVYF